MLLRWQQHLNWALKTRTDRYEKAIGILNTVQSANKDVCGGNSGHNVRKQESKLERQVGTTLREPSISSKIT